MLFTILLSNYIVVNCSQSPWTVKLTRLWKSMVITYRGWFLRSGSHCVYCTVCTYRCVRILYVWSIVRVLLDDGENPKKSTKILLKMKYCIIEQYSIRSRNYVFYKMRIKYITHLYKQVVLDARKSSLNIPYPSNHYLINGDFINFCYDLLDFD